jgi:hypothetical protein
MEEFAQSMPNLTAASQNLLRVDQRRWSHCLSRRRHTLSDQASHRHRGRERLAHCQEKTSHKIDIVVALAMASLAAVQKGELGRMRTGVYRPLAGEIKWIDDKSRPPLRTAHIDEHGKGLSPEQAHEVQHAWERRRAKTHGGIVACGSQETCRRSKGAAERMSFLEKRGDDPVVASALLEAPAFLSGLSDAEITLVRHKIEKKHLSPEIVEAKNKITSALDELERGHRAASSLVMQRVGLKKEMPTIAKAAPKMTKEASFSEPVWVES